MCLEGALRTGSSASLVHARGRGSWCIFPGLQLDGVLVPLNYIHAYTFKHFLPVCWSVVGRACLQMAAYWAPGSWRAGYGGHR